MSPRPCLRPHPASVRRSGVQIPALPQRAPPDDRAEHQGGSDGRGCGSRGGVGGAQEYDSRSRPALCSAAENRGWEARHPLPPLLPRPFFWCPLMGPGPPLSTVSFSPPPPPVRPPLSPAGLARAPGSNQRRPPRTPSPPPPPAPPPRPAPAAPRGRLEELPAGVRGRGRGPRGGGWGSPPDAGAGGGMGGEGQAARGRAAGGSGGAAGLFGSAGWRPVQLPGGGDFEGGGSGRPFQAVQAARSADDGRRS